MANTQEKFQTSNSTQNYANPLTKLGEVLAIGALRLHSFKSSKQLLNSSDSALASGADLSAYPTPPTEIMDEKR